jgi:Fe2+ or Zn2+ uptake regulation protein
VRKTRQREVNIEELLKLRTHPSAAELYAIVKKRLPRISLGTVYRNLEVLSREGVIHRLEVAGSQMRFDGELEEHRHIRCIRCGRVDDLAGGSRLNACDKNVVKRTGYRMLERRVEFLGICPECRQRERGT